MIYRRKVYDELLKWKKTAQGRKTVLIEGARRTGKSTIAESFGKNEYRSCVVIDFNKATRPVKEAFDHLDNMDIFYQLLALRTGVRLYPRESLIIFDEIQKFPRAREATKYLAEDGRYDVLATGSLISIKENVGDITVPSEEHKIKMYPMDLEEFFWAMNEDLLWEHIRDCFTQQIPLERSLHEKAMHIFREYMLVGGMPKSVDAYLSSGRDFFASDVEKRYILELYRDDIRKAAKRYSSRISAIFEHLPSYLSSHEKRIVLSQIDPGSTFEEYDDPIFWLSDSMICNACYRCNDPSIGLALNLNESYVKAYMGDTGLLVSLAFSEKELSDSSLYRDIMDSRLSLNEGMLYENVIAQMLVAGGRSLYFYTHYDASLKRNDIEVDFLLSNRSKVNYKLYPVEVKSSKNYSTTSLNAFRQRFGRRIDKSYIIHPKTFSIEGDLVKYPPYMVPLL